MQKDELIIQLLKIGLGLLFAAYFVWWSLAVLSRLPPHKECCSKILSSEACVAFITDGATPAL
jgi:hypothetical protein